MSSFCVAIPASPFLTQRMAGLTGVARSIILAELAGARTIYLVSPRPQPADWERSFAARERPLPNVVRVAAIEDIPADAMRATVLLPDDRLLTAEGLRRLIDGEPAAMLAEGRDFFAAAAAADVTWRILVASMKPSEGWFGRHLNRPISFRLSALLMRWDVSPNAVTWFTFALAMVMAVLLAQGGAWRLALGGLLYQAVSVIDCVDGDIARVTYRTSRSGAALDTAFDMLANLGFAFGVTIGLVRTYGTGQLETAVAMLAVAITCMLLMTLLIRLGPRRGSFDVLRAALGVRLGGRPALMRAVLTAEKLFKRDFYALFAACLCVTGLAWLIPVLTLGGVCIWLGAIVWCAPVIVADKRGALLPAHLQA